MSEPAARGLSRRLLLRGLSLAPLVALAACGGIVSGRDRGDRSFYSLPAVTPASGPRVAWQLVVEAPEAGSSLDRTRIALQRPDGQFDYFGDATWSDRPSALVQQQLIQSFANSGRIVGLARDSLSLRADYLLRSELRTFNAVYAQLGQAPVVRTTLAVQLVRMPDRVAVDGQIVDVSVPATQDAMGAIALAFEQAFGEVQRRVVDWTLATGEADYRTRG